MLGKGVIEERDVRFVSVIGGIPVRDERRRTTNAVELEFEGWKSIKVQPETDLPEEDVGSRIGQADSVLNV